MVYSFQFVSTLIAGDSAKALSIQLSSGLFMSLAVLPDLLTIKLVQSLRPPSTIVQANRWS